MPIAINILKTLILLISLLIIPPKANANPDAKTTTLAPQTLNTVKVSVNVVRDTIDIPDNFEILELPEITKKFLEVVQSKTSFIFISNERQWSDFVSEFIKIKNEYSNREIVIFYPNRSNPIHLNFPKYVHDIDTKRFTALELPADDFFRLRKEATFSDVQKLVHKGENWHTTKLASKKILFKLGFLAMLWTFAPDVITIGYAGYFVYDSIDTILTTKFVNDLDKDYKKSWLAEAMNKLTKIPFLTNSFRKKLYRSSNVLENSHEAKKSNSIAYSDGLQLGKRLIIRATILSMIGAAINWEMYSTEKMLGNVLIVSSLFYATNSARQRVVRRKEMTDYESSNMENRIWWRFVPLLLLDLLSEKVFPNLNFLEKNTELYDFLNKSYKVGFETIGASFGNFTIAAFILMIYTYRQVNKNSEKMAKPGAISSSFKKGYNYIAKLVLNEQKSINPSANSNSKIKIHRVTLNNFNLSKPGICNSLLKL